MHFDCAGSRKVCAAGFSSPGPAAFSCKVSHKRVLVEILLDSFLRGSCMMYRSLTEDLVEILVGSSLRGICVRSLQMPCLRGACMKALVRDSWEVLVSRSCKIRYSSSRSFYDDLVRFS